MTNEVKKRRGRPPGSGMKQLPKDKRSKVKIVEDLSFSHEECSTLWIGLQLRAKALKIELQRSHRLGEPMHLRELLEEEIKKNKELMHKLTLGGTVFY